MLVLLYILVARAELPCGKSIDINFTEPSPIIETYIWDRSCAGVSPDAMYDRWNATGRHIPPGMVIDYIVNSKGIPGVPDDCSRNIAANQILVGVSWKRDVDRLCWHDAYMEKRSRYSGNIVDNAFAAVYACCKSSARRVTDIVILVGVAVIGTIVGIVIACMLPRYLNRFFTAPSARRETLGDIEGKGAMENAGLP